MKYIDINSCLEYVDEMFDNSYSRKAKFRWLNEIESRVQLNVMLLQAESTRDYVAEDKVSCNAEFQARSIRLERKIKARAGGTISISGCSIEGNNTDAEISAVSEDGKTLLFDSDIFDEGTDAATFEYDGGSCTLLAPEPFTDIYYNYIFMKLSEHLEESAEQNNRAVTFDKSFTRFMRWWANTYSPADEKAMFKGYYLVGDRGLPGADGDRGEPGTSIDHIYTDENNHMIVVLTDGSEYDAGYIGVELDPTLSIPGAAAPADAVGEALRSNNAIEVTVEKTGSYIISADKTYAEIMAEVDAGKTVLKLLPDNEYYVLTDVFESGTISFARIVGAGTSGAYERINIGSNNTWATARAELVKEAPSDGKQYARKDGAWAEVQGGSGGTPSLDADGVLIFPNGSPSLNDDGTLVF